MWSSLAEMRAYNLVATLINRLDALEASPRPRAARGGDGGGATVSPQHEPPPLRIPAPASGAEAQRAGGDFGAVLSGVSWADWEGSPWGGQVWKIELLSGFSYQHIETGRREVGRKDRLTVSHADEFLQS